MGIENSEKTLNLTPGRRTTPDYSYFLREKNIQGIAELLTSREPVANGWQILSVGCGEGPEPQELALRLVAGGVTNFTIEAIDYSRRSLYFATQNRVYVDDYSSLISDKNNFMQQMIERGLLLHEEAPRPEDYQLSKPAENKYAQLSPNVSRHIHYTLHDILLQSYSSPGSYDVVLCNHVLSHYQRWERDIILTHILQSLKNSGLLGLENSRMGIGYTPSIKQRQKQQRKVDDYWQWRNELTKFGLTKESVPIGDDRSISIYRYTQANNTVDPESVKIALLKKYDQVRTTLLSNCDNF